MSIMTEYNKQYLELENALRRLEQVKERNFVLVSVTGISKEMVEGATANLVQLTKLIEAAEEAMRKHNSTISAGG